MGYQRKAHLIPWLLGTSHPDPYPKPVQSRGGLHFPSSSFLFLYTPAILAACSLGLLPPGWLPLGPPLLASWPSTPLLVHLSSLLFSLSFLPLLHSPSSHGLVGLDPSRCLWLYAPLILTIKPFSSTIPKGSRPHFIYWAVE